MNLQKKTCLIFDKNTEETFDGTDGCTVEHHRNVLLVVLADIFSTEALRQVEVHLDRTALPVTSEAILEREFEYRAEEGAFARVQHVVKTCKLCGFGESGFRLVPDFIGTHALCRAGRELHLHIVKSEVVVDFLDQVAEVSDFACLSYGRSPLVRVGLYFRGCRRRFARRPPPKTESCYAGLRPKGSLSLTQILQRTPNF